MSKRMNAGSVVRTFVACVAALSLVGCAGSARTGDDPDSGNPGSEDVNLADYEVFDIGPFRDAPADESLVVDHDVPEELMQSRADAGVVEVVPGYRVQVFSSVDRNEAVVAEEDFRTWWEALTAADREAYQLPGTISVYNNYKQPLYRVRVGDFTTRAEAERLMSLMAQRFATVFVVPDQVTVRR